MQIGEWAGPIAGWAVISAIGEWDGPTSNSVPFSNGPGNGSEQLCLMKQAFYVDHSLHNKAFAHNPFATPIVYYYPLCLLH